MPETESKVYSEYSLLKEEPRGEQLYVDNLGIKWKMFICYGCQNCFNSYPHILSAEKVNV